MKDKKSALIVVDMQNDFVREDGALYVAGVRGEPSMNEVVGNINALIQMDFVRVVFTQDWHPIGHVEFSVFGEHCVANTFGAEIFDGVKGAKDCQTVSFLKKGRDPATVGFSVAMSDNFSAHINGLRHVGIKRILVAGLAYTHCVGETAISYAQQGFETYVILGATRSVPPPYGDHKKMDRKLALYGVKRARHSCVLND